MELLKGMKVVDLTNYASAPAATRILADWGADVIKVEPRVGDVSRHMNINMGIPKEDTTPWDVLNSNKRDIALDLKTPKAMEILHKLLLDADVFVTNIRTKPLKKMGLSYEELSKKYPKLIYAHLTGYGYEGSSAHHPGFDTIAYWARGGAMVDIVQSGGHPVIPAFAMGDVPTGTNLLAGILAAYINQQRTGKGDRVSVSLFSSSIWNNVGPITFSQYGDKFPKDRYDCATALLASYQCKDGEWIMLCALEYDRYWPAVCKVIGREELITDERLCSMMGGIKNKKIGMQALEELFATKNAKEWGKLLEEIDFPYEICQHFIDVSKDEQAWDNNYLYEVNYPSGNKIALARTPVEFKEAGLTPTKLGPKLGEHTREILLDLGYTEDEIEEMKNTKQIKIS